MPWRCPRYRNARIGQFGQHRALVGCPRTQAESDAEAECRRDCDAVAFSPDGKYLAAGTRYGKVQIWDSIGMNEIKTLEGHAGDVWAIAFNHNGTILASGDGDWNRPGSVRLWNTETWKPQSTLKHTGEVLSLAFAPKTDLLAAGSWDKTVKVWDLNDRLWRLPTPRELGGKGNITPILKRE